MFCEECGTKVEDDVVFCPNCGNKMSADTENESANLNGNLVNGETAETGDEKTVIVNGGQSGLFHMPDTAESQEQNEASGKMKFCPKCGTANVIESAFCVNCGETFEQEKAAVSAGKVKKPINRKLLTVMGITAAAAVLVVVGVGVFSLFRDASRSGSKNYNIIYEKDNELYTAKPGKYEPKEITDDFFDGEHYENGPMIQYYSHAFQYTDDDKYILYPRKINFSSLDTFDLYYQKTNEKNGNETKIDSDVSQFYALSSKQLLYIKGSDDKRFYLSDYEGNKEKLGSNASFFEVSADKKKVYWLERDNDNELGSKLYVQDISKKNSEKVKIDTVSNIYDVSDDLNTIVYRKNDALYISTNGEKGNKIASDVESAAVYGINDKVSIVYEKDNEDDTGYSMMDLVNDDCAALDAAMTEPDIRDYQTVTTEPSFWGTREVVTTDDAYYDALEQYDQKRERDNYRQYLEGTSSSLRKIDIYYYTADSNDSEFITSAISKEFGVSGFLDKVPVCYYQECDIENMDKPDLSDLVRKVTENGYYIENMISEQLMKVYKIKYIYNNEIREIPETDGFDEYTNVGLIYDDTTDSVYYYVLRDYFLPSESTDETADAKEDDSREKSALYRFDYKSKNPKFELISDEITDTPRMIEEGIAYFCDTNADTRAGDLYINGEEVASDVIPSSLLSSKKYGTLFITDCAKDKDEGTLNLYKNGKAYEIADDVYSGLYGFVEDGKAAYLVDYNFEKYRGDLEIYNGKESVFIDSDVCDIVFKYQS